jgi:hypothetical protein
LSAELSLAAGDYLIKRTLPFQPRAFETEAEALAWIEAIQSRTLQEEGWSEYFRLLIQGENFVVHQMRTTNGTQFSPNMNLMVAVADVSWAFEESANRVTIISNRFDTHHDALPVAGLMEAGVSFASELRTFGLRELALTTAVDLDPGRIAGSTRQGKAYTARISRGPRGRVQRILGTFQGSDAADQRFDLSWSEGGLMAVVHSRPDPVTSAWVESARYEVIRARPLPSGFRFSSYWARFANAATAVFVYDPEQKLLAQSYGGELVPVRSLDDQGPVVEMSRVRRAALLGVLAAVTASWALAWLRRNRGRTGRGGILDRRTV